MNQTARYLGITFLLALGLGVPGVQAQQPVSAEPQAPSGTVQAPRERSRSATVPRLQLRGDRVALRGEPLGCRGRERAVAGRPAGGEQRQERGEDEWASHNLHNVVAARLDSRTCRCR